MNNLSSRKLLIVPPTSDSPLSNNKGHALYVSRSGPSITSAQPRQLYSRVKSLHSIDHGYTQKMESKNGHAGVSILDICQGELSSSLLDDIHNMLRPGKGEEKRLPTMLLYDARGLQLFEDITYLEEYYLTNAEIEVLENYSSEIAKSVPAGSLILELGSGNLRKVEILLRAFENAGKEVQYHALDLSLSELTRTLSDINHGEYKYVRCQGLHGTYEDGLAWLKHPKNRDKSKLVLFLGSSLGNFTRAEAANFLKGFVDVLTPDDAMLIGLDACQNKEKVYPGYNDREGKTREFYLNGLAHANTLFGHDEFKEGSWDVVGEYDEVAGRHQAFYVPTTDVVIDGVQIKAGEKIRFEESYKYSKSHSTKLWQTSGFVTRAVLKNTSDDYHLHLLSMSKLSPLLATGNYATQPVPSLAEFKQLWAALDTVMWQMIPAGELLAKPIRLRHCFLFYMGHTPTFLDIHVASAIQGPPTEPASFRKIFERGIDPDVDEPSICHPHSEIPETWPPEHEVIAFKNRVRDRVRALYESGTAGTNRKLGRALWLGFEHEAMHLETLLYMLLQSDKILPPPGNAPNFALLSRNAREEAVPNKWHQIPAQTIVVGIDDPETDSGPTHYFGWDNEKPQRQVSMPAFEAKARPITNEDFALYLEQSGQLFLPAMWITNDRGSDRGPGDSIYSSGCYMNGESRPLTETYLDGKSVKTVYGPIPLRYALDWPMIASYDELMGCAEWMGGRIPTLNEARSIYKYVDALKTKEAEEVQARTISAVNGHLSNNGVQESPPPQHWLKGGCSAELSHDFNQLFINLEGCNVGFRNFHPTPVTQNRNRPLGQSEMGGVWEWTSSALEKHNGFKPLELYPGYTADFFDGKHNIVLGGSWATHPRIAGRKTFVNWYQRNYGFAWACARLVHDV